LLKLDGALRDKKKVNVMVVPLHKDRENFKGDYKTEWNEVKLETHHSPYFLTPLIFLRNSSLTLRTG
jgi:hypothetical protein